MAFSRLGRILTQALFNGLLDRLEAQNTNQHGRGVLSGCAISAGSGLEVSVSAGWILAVAPTQIAAVASVVLPASSTRYIFLDSAGSVSLSPSAADPGGETVCLGSVTTDGSAVVSVSAAGRVNLARWSGLREWQIGDGQIVCDLESRQTQLGGQFHWPFEISTLTATKALGGQSANIQRIQCAAGQKVLLPDPADVTHGCVFQIYNDNAGGGADITVRNDSDSTTIATITPESVEQFSLAFDGTSWLNR